MQGKMNIVTQRMFVPKEKRQRTAVRATLTPFWASGYTFIT